MSVTWNVQDTLSERAGRRRGLRRLARRQRMRRRERVESVLLGATLVAVLLLGASAPTLVDAWDSAARQVRSAVVTAVKGEANHGF